MSEEEGCDRDGDEIVDAFLLGVFICEELDLSSSIFSSSFFFICLTGVFASACTFDNLALFVGVALLVALDETDTSGPGESRKEISVIKLAGGRDDDEGEETG